MNRSRSARVSKGYGVCVRVGVWVTVGVRVGVGGTGVAVLVRVGVNVAVSVDVGVTVSVGVADAVGVPRSIAMLAGSSLPGGGLSERVAIVTSKRSETTIHSVRFIQITGCVTDGSLQMAWAATHRSVCLVRNLQGLAAAILAPGMGSPSIRRERPVGFRTPAVPPGVVPGAWQWSSHPSSAR